jgi:hypothetical protein
LKGVFVDLNFDPFPNTPRPDSLFVTCLDFISDNSNLIEDNLPPFIYLNLDYLAHTFAIARNPYFNKRWIKGIKSSIRSRESDGYGSKGSKLFSLIFKNEAEWAIQGRLPLSLLQDPTIPYNKF